ncbi:AAA family ATPase [Archaeoglobus sp.]
MKEFSLYERRNSKVSTFSKGMKQKLMFCISMICEPDVLFLDEPTSGLDVASARMIRMKILEIADTGVTVFFTSHNMDEVDLLCNRVAIIKDGRIVAEDTPDGIKELVGGSVAVEVRFDRNVDFEGKRIGDRYVVYTTDPNETICRIVEFTKSKGVRIVSINTRSPSLEDAFLKILGEMA